MANTAAFVPMSGVNHHDAANVHGSAGVINASHLAQKRNLHQRTYQACQNCRNSKTKCDRGDVDKPNPGACARCLREGKVCEVAPQRSKKRKVDTTEHSTEDGSGDEASRQKNRGNASHTQKASVDSSTTVPTSSPAEGLNHTSKNDYSEIDRAIPRIFQQQTFRSESDSLAGIATVNNTLKGSSPTGRRRLSLRSPLNGIDVAPLDTSGAAASSNRKKFGKTASPAEFQAACTAWSRFTLVRNRLLTAQEAINYIQSFYFYMAELSPVAISSFQEISSHHELLDQEPILALTIITITSRYFLPAAPNSKPGIGATSRATEIHTRCWNLLETLISRTLWGRDRVGSSKPHQGLRSYGTIESMLLLTEWHARALHFPPTDGPHIVVSTEDIPDQFLFVRPERSYSQRDAEGNTINAWLEPCVRSGRMSWSLLNNAWALAVELGVFDSSNFNDPRAALSPNQLRAQRLGRLLCIFMESTCLRLGLGTDLPGKPDCVRKFIEKSRACKDETIEREHVLYHWEQIGEIHTTGCAEIFKNYTHTQALIKRRGYEALVMKYDKLLRDHSASLGKCKTIPRDQRRILNIEIQFARVNLGSVALQAIMDRILSSNSSTHAQTESISPDILTNAIEPDREILNQLVQASLSFLRTVASFIEEGPSGSFKFIPVRSFFRITSVSMILFQCFYMGLTPEHAARSLKLLKDTANALQTMTCDDVHVSGCIGDVLKSLYDRLQSTMRYHPTNADSGNATGTFQAPSAPAVTSPPTMRQTQQHIDNNKHASHATSPYVDNDEFEVASFMMESKLPPPSLAELEGIQYYQSGGSTDQHDLAHAPPPPVNMGAGRHGLNPGWNSGWFSAPIPEMLQDASGSRIPMFENLEAWMSGKGMELFEGLGTGFGGVPGPDPGPGPGPGVGGHGTNGVNGNGADVGDASGMGWDPASGGSIAY